MAYRRRSQPTPSTWTPSSTFNSYHNQRDEDRKGRQSDQGARDSNSAPTTGLAAKAIGASSAAQTFRDSSLSSAYATFPSSPSSSSSIHSSSNASKVQDLSDSSRSYTSMSSFNKPNPNPNPDPDRKPGRFWGTLARKAKSIIDEVAENGDQRQRQYQHDRDLAHQQHHSHSPADPKPRSDPPIYSPKNGTPTNESRRKKEGPVLRKGLNAISSSLNYIGNAVEEGLTKVENRTADIIQETRKHIRERPGGSAAQNQTTSQSAAGLQPQVQGKVQQPQTQTELELQLKASRDVAMAMAAKAKLLLRELKTVKADLAFANERCTQLEDENKVLRESRESGGSLEDDDLIRLQLESLLAEKARLAHENSVFARENRFLSEVVEYHQLTMQDVVYLDEGTEEVTQVYPVKVVSHTLSSPTSSEMSTGTNLVGNRETLVHPVPPPGLGMGTEEASR